MYEHYFQCPYCWDEISMLLDPSIQQQNYVEDCEICCNPIEISSQFNISNELESFHAHNLEQ